MLCWEHVIQNNTLKEVNEEVSTCKGRRPLMSGEFLVVPCVGASETVRELVFSILLGVTPFSPETSRWMEYVLKELFHKDSESHTGLC